jgi:hypothetical protein
VRTYIMYCTIIRSDDYYVPIMTTAQYTGTKIEYLTVPVCILGTEPK